MQNKKKQNSQFVGVAAIPTKLTKKNWCISLHCTDHDLSALYIMNDNRVIEIERGCWQRCLPTPLESFPPSLSSSSVLHFCLLISSFALSTIAFSLTHIDNNCPSKQCLCVLSFNQWRAVRVSTLGLLFLLYVCVCVLLSTWSRPPSPLSPSVTIPNYIHKSSPLPSSQPTYNGVPSLGSCR